jgi:phytoene dehydrogenase-like protein
MDEKKIVIIGAGPTGLGAAYRLKELGYKNFHMYEATDHLGGLASSYTDFAGFTWDIGGHVMFSHYKYYDQCFDTLMGNDFQMNMRECWVRMFVYGGGIRRRDLQVFHEALQFKSMGTSRGADE